MTKYLFWKTIRRHGAAWMALCLLGLGIGGCQKCRDCTLTRTLTIDGVGTETSTEIREYCGSTLKDVEANSSYEKDGVRYNWDCTK